ncbi:MAG TPA: TlpA disulfide reductase family protein [Woeseiaceae bacterium]
MLLSASLLFAAPFLHADDWRNELVLAGFADNALHGESLRDRPVLLQFWESWCRSCGQLMSDMDEVAARFPSVRYLVVSTDEHAADARQRLESHPLFSRKPERFFHDATQQLEKHFDVTTVPTVLVLGTDGRERLRHVGHFNSSELSRLVSLLAELDSTSAGSSP